jgi:hypothetical protein
MYDNEDEDGERKNIRRREAPIKEVWQIIRHHKGRYEALLNKSPQLYAN